MNTYILSINPYSQYMLDIKRYLIKLVSLGEFIFRLREEDVLKPQFTISEELYTPFWEMVSRITPFQMRL